MLQTVFITALTVLVGRFILEYFIDGIYNDSFANGFLRILEAFHVSEETATSLYWQWIGNNKVFFMILGFLLLFSLFFTYAPTYPHYPQVYKSPLLPIFFPFQILFFCTHLINLHVFYIFSAFPLDIYKPALLVIQYSAYESQKQFL